MPGSKQYFPQEILDIIGEGPPKPTGDPETNRAAYKAYRDWAAAGFDALDNARKSGRTLKDMGVQNAPGMGQSLINRDNFISAYGDRADAKWIYDPVHNRKKKRPGAGGGTDYSYGGRSNSGNPMESGGWIPMDPGELSGGYSGGFENAQGRKGRREMMHYGHLNKDPVTGMYFNIGTGNPQDPSTWQWVDQNNHKVPPPSPEQAQQVIQANQAQITGAGGAGQPQTPQALDPNSPGYWNQVFGSGGYQNPVHPNIDPVSSPNPPASSPLVSPPVPPANSNLPSSPLMAPPTPSGTSGGQPIDPFPGGNPIQPQKYWSATLGDPNHDGTVSIDEILAGAGSNTRRKQMTDYLDQVAMTGGMPDYNFMSRIGTSVGAGGIRTPGTTIPRPPSPPPKTNVPTSPQMPTSPSIAPRPSTSFASTPFTKSSTVLSSPTRSFINPQQQGRPSISGSYESQQPVLRQRPRRVGFGL